MGAGGLRGRGRDGQGGEGAGAARPRRQLRQEFNHRVQLPRGGLVRLLRLLRRGLAAD